MRIPLIFFLCSLSQSIFANSLESQNKTEKSILLPPEVKIAVDIAKTCHHLAGEINGDKSNRDREVIEEIEKLECEKNNLTISNLRKKFMSNRNIREQLNKYILKP